MPPEPSFLTADWHDLAMLNYEIDSAVSKARVPAGCELDLWFGRAFVSVVGLTVAVFAVSALAQETWMMPSMFSATVGDVVRLDRSSGMAFPRRQDGMPARLGRGRAMLAVVRLVPAQDGRSWLCDFCTLRFAIRP